jgi:hypothetical protein
MKIHSYDLVCRLRLLVHQGVESRRELQLNTDHCEELAPEVASEHEISITDKGVWNPVQLDDGVEEDPCDGGGGVGMPQWNEVQRLREPVNDSKDHRFAMYLRQSLHEVECDIYPYHGRYHQRLQHTMVGTTNGCRSPAGWSCIVLFHWHTRQAQTKSRTAVRAPGT